MAEYSTLFPDIQPHVASCPVPSITRAIQRTAQDFFQRSEAYRHRIAATNVTSGATNLTVSIPANTRIIAPLTMYLDGERMATTNEEILAINFGDWRTATPTVPRFIMADDKAANGLIVALPSNGTYELTGTIALKPTSSATELDDDYMELYKDTLVEGVLARLLMMRNTEWYEPNLGKAYEMDFERGIDEAQNVSNKGNTSRVMTTTYGGI